ncbi:MAG: UDP-N-acetylmuramoyl-L-alanine--D-glutamate ligase [Actinobacteria bacterium]|nr:UDP-N-acetylmuramoyl-L-alanine--D-glutamate ligase [Actinomycetota bacterium]
MGIAVDLEDIGHLLVLGMARSGIAAALAARRLLPGTKVVLADRQSEPKAAGEAAGLEAAGIQVELGREDTALLDGCDLVVKSPGIPQENPLLLEARVRGIPVWGEIEFASRFLTNMFLGVTGTNGKTTTVELLGHIIGASGRPCRVAGNVGLALSSLAGDVKPEELLVVELSSFQLEDIVEFRPGVAILLNLTEDHLDRHPDLEEYFAAKMRIFENQEAEDVSVINLDDPRCRRSVPGHAARVWFSRRAGDDKREAGETAEPLVFIRDGVIRANLHGLATASAGLRGRLPRAWKQLFEADSGRNGSAGGEVSGETGEAAGETGSHEIFDWRQAGLKGEHNLDNCLAATAACLCLGLSPEEIAAGIESFPGVPHRLQEVREVDGVTYYNDSKATNVDATLKALTAFRRGVHLILGGRSKGCDFDELAREASSAKVNEVILIGEAANDIAASFDLIGGEVVMAGDLEQAIRIAVENAGPGDTVLLSPACASFDQYDNYERRGEHFVELVNGLQPRGD